MFGRAFLATPFFASRCAPLPRAGLCGSAATVWAESGTAAVARGSPGLRSGQCCHRVGRERYCSRSTCPSASRIGSPGCELEGGAAARPSKDQGQNGGKNAGTSRCVAACCLRATPITAPPGNTFPWCFQSVQTGSVGSTAPRLVQSVDLVRRLRKNTYRGTLVGCHNQNGASARGA
ncbi:uncharacterized protein FYW23_002623 isoform 1-T6 [Sylvia borin]